MTRLLPLMLALLLAGCAGRAPYEPPVLWTPAAWRSAGVGITTDPVTREWWLGFNDPVLAGLMRRAVGNPAVRAATARIPTDRPPKPAETEARRAALVQARTAAALAYMRLRGAQARLARARATGVDTAALPELELAEAQGINAVGLLLGAPPGALDGELRPAAPVPAPPARIAAGLPSELARRRPDVRLAELALREAEPAEAGPAAAAYQTAVLRAFTEVDDAMLAYAAAQRRRAALGRRSGVEEDLAVAAVALYGALGTGWEPPASPSPSGRGPG